MDNPNGNDWFQGEDAAILEALESGNLMDGLNAVETNDGLDESEMENFIEGATKDMESQISNETEEAVAEEESLDGEEESEAESESEEIESSDGEDAEETELFVDGPSGKKIQVDLKPDRDKIVKLHQAADRARMYQSQIDKMKHEAGQNSEKMESLSEDSKLFNQLSDMTDELDISDPSSFNDIISVLTEGEVTFDSLIEKAIEEREYLGDLSDDALALYEAKKELKLERRELEKAKQRRSRDEAKSKSEHEARIEEEQRSMIFNAFTKHDVRGTLGDPSRENGIMQRAWDQSKLKLSSYDEVTPELAEEVFKSEIEFFSGPKNEVVSKEVDKVVRKRSASATNKVQKAVKPSTKSTREEIEDMGWDALSNLDNFKLF
jgi:hypothetical protein